MRLNSELYIDKEGNKWNRIKSVSLILLLIPFILTSGLSNFEIVQLVSKLQWEACLIIVITYLFHFRKPNRLILWTLIFSMILILSTVINNANIAGSIRYLIPIISVLLWCEIAFKYFPKRALQFLVFYYLIIAVMNIISIYLFPEGLFIDDYENIFYLIANRNDMAPVLIPSMCLFLFYRNLRSKDSILNTLFAVAFFTFPLFKLWTGTGVTLAFICLMLALIWKFKFFARLIKYKTLIYIAASIFILICVFQIVLFSGFIENFLHKSLTFTGRTYLWSQALDRFKGSWLYGYGVYTSLDVIYTIPGKLALYSAHNMILQFASWGGIILLISFIGILFSARRIYQIFYGCKYLWLSIFSILIFFMFETLTAVPLFWISLSLLQNMNVFIKESSEG